MGETYGGVSLPDGALETYEKIKGHLKRLYNVRIQTRPDTLQINGLSRVSFAFSVAAAVYAQSIESNVNPSELLKDPAYKKFKDDPTHFWGHMRELAYQLNFMEQ